MAPQNEVVIAAAGSGKTEHLLKLALQDPESRVLITTYTNENLREVNHRLWEMHGGQPSNVTVMTWFEFLLRDGVKPYQTFKTEIGRIRSINFISVNPPFARRADFEDYYLDSASNIYSDAVSDLAYELDVASDGRVIRRLDGIYDKILIDEMQDLAGYDLEFLHRLLKSKIQIAMVGDPRQAVYLTNRSGKNSQYRGAKLVDWIAKRVKDGLCVHTSLDVSHRCNQAICLFADSLYPDYPATSSANATVVDHTGMILVHVDDIATYLEHYSAQELQWDRRNKIAGKDARNFGQVKGQSFERVLIYPTNTITAYIEGGQELKDVTLAKFYVAVTRAWHSVAIVTKKRTTKSLIPIWQRP